MTNTKGAREMHMALEDMVVMVEPDGSMFAWNPDYVPIMEARGRRKATEQEAGQYWAWLESLEG